MKRRNLKIITSKNFLLEALMNIRQDASKIIFYTKKIHTYVSYIYKYKVRADIYFILLLNR